MLMTGLARIGRDAELRYTPNGDAVTDLSLAFNYGKKGEDGRKPSQWVSASLFGKRAEALAEYLTKGTTLWVSLEDPHVETYAKRDGGGEGFRLTAKVSSLEFAGTPERAPAPAPAPRAAAPAPRPAPAPRAPAPAPRTTSSAFADMDDDIPF